MPWSSPRSSGWRATAWIIEPKMLPMPMPAPAAPRPTPTPKAIARPMLVTSPVIAARTVPKVPLPLVFGFDCPADVDGGEEREDEGLDRDHDRDLEDVDRDAHGNRDHREHDRFEDEDQAEHHEDEHVAGQHVGEESDGERDQAHELGDHLEHGDRPDQHLRDAPRDPALDVLDRAVVANALDVRRDERDQR